MKYAIAIALLAMSVTASASDESETCRIMSSWAKAAAMLYQNNVPLPEARSEILGYFADQGLSGEAGSTLTDYTLMVMRKLYTGEIYMPQVGATFPDWAERQAQSLANRIYARCMAGY